MAVIKISDKDTIDKLQAKLILRLGRKISQQETLDLCINYADEHIDDIMLRIHSRPTISQKKAELIKEKFAKYKGTPYNRNATFSSDYDNDAYSL